MADPDFSHAQELSLLGQLATRALTLWDMPVDAVAQLINVSENTTYLITAPDGYRAIMRVHRENYHSRLGIKSELAWLDALGAAGKVATPGYYLGRDGQAIQECAIEGLARPRFVVLFKYVDGAAPDENGDLRLGFQELGAIAAQCHQHVLEWQRPQKFERLIWDIDSVFGPKATWGNWRDAPGVTPHVQETLEQVETVIRRRLAAYGTSPARFNLIHADMRLANLIISKTGTRLIDFDDCGFGWFMYDFAAAISFIEDDPRVPALRVAWLKGYRSVCTLGQDDEAEIDTFVMLRRMALLAWIGSHIDAPEPQQLAPEFAATTAQLGGVFLKAQTSEG